MRRGMKAPLRGLLAVGCLAGAAHGGGRPDRCTCAWTGLALAALVVGILGLVLPGAGLSQGAPDGPGILASTLIHPPQILVVGSGEPSLVSPPEARPMAGTRLQASPAPDDLAQDDGDLDDDDPSSPPVRTRGALGLPLPSARMGVIGATSAVPWPFPYLTRPKLLTRP
jgi:hypothetical protein